MIICHKENRIPQRVVCNTLTVSAFLECGIMKGHIVVYAVSDALDSFSQKYILLGNCIKTRG